MHIPMVSLKNCSVSDRLQSVIYAIDANNKILDKIPITGGVASSMVLPFAFGLYELGLFPKASHKKLSDSHSGFKSFNNEKLDRIQNNLEKGLEKWGNINNERDHINLFNTTMRP